MSPNGERAADGSAATTNATVAASFSGAAASAVALRLAPWFRKVRPGVEQKGRASMRVWASYMQPSLQNSGISRYCLAALGFERSSHGFKHRGLDVPGNPKPGTSTNAVEGTAAAKRATAGTRICSFFLLKASIYRSRKSTLQLDDCQSLSNFIANRSHRVTSQQARVRQNPARD